MTYNKIDANHKQIVKELRSKGYKVSSLADLKNACDLLVYNGHRYELFEVKNPEYCSKIALMDQGQRKRFLTKGEAKFAEDFRVYIVISSQEIIDIFASDLTIDNLIEIDEWIKKDK